MSEKNQIEKTPAPVVSAFVDAVKSTRNTFSKMYSDSAEKIFLQEYGFAQMQAGGNPKLSQCDPTSVKNALIQVALTGITLNPARAFAYLVPRNGKCCLDLSYQGMIDLMVRSGSVKAMSGNVIFDNEKYEYKEGSNPILEHYPELNREMKEGKCLAAYCIATLASGEKQAFLLGRNEIMKHKAVSPGSSSNYSPWNGDFWQSMYIKTVIRYAYKFLPKTEKGDQLIEILNNSNNVSFERDSREIQYQ